MSAPTRTEVVDVRQGSLSLLVVVIAVVGLNIRAGLGAVPPLLPQIVDEYGISNTLAGLLTSTAALAIGLCAPLGQRLGARIGAEAATAWCLALLCVCGLTHLASRSAGMLFLTVAATGAAMGAGSSMIPALISQRAGRRRGLVMGVYSTGMALGIGATAALAVPLEHALGGWRPALAASGVLAGLATVAWLLGVARSPAAAAPSGLPRDHRLPWASPTARLITAYLAVQMMVGYGCMAWIAPLYLDLGRSAGTSAAMLVTFQSVQLVSMLGLPALSDHTADHRVLLALAGAFTCLGVGMLLVAPSTLGVPAVALAGLGVGGGATLGLILVVDVTDTVADGSRLTAMTLLVSNLLGAAGPLLLGAVKDATGSFRPGLAVLLALTVATFPLARVLRPGRRM